MFNIVVLEGRITHSLELKKTPNGKSVLTFDIAYNYQNANREKETDFFTCVAWNTNAEFIERNFRKGQGIGVRGKLKTRNYTDRNGNKKTKYEIIVEEATFIGSKEENPTQGEFEGNNKDISEETEEFTEIEADDDLPF